MAALRVTPLSDAVTVAVVFAVTGTAVTLNVPVADPLGTVTDAGVVNDPLLSLSVTTVEDGAALLSVTTHVEVPAPLRLVGLQLSDVRLAGAGVSVMAAVRVAPLSDAVTVAVVFAVTAAAVTVTVPVADPLGTVTDAGVVNDPLLSLSVTTVEDGAALLNVTTHVEVPAPVRRLGLQLSEVKFAGIGVRVIDAVRVTPLSDAVTVAVVFAVTAVAVTLNVPVADPLGTATNAGVAKEPLLSLSVTLVPPDGAALLSVTTQVELPGALMLVGLQLSDVRLAGVGVSVMEALRVTPLSDAVTVPVVLAVTAAAATLKVPLADPPGIVTDAGVVNDPLLSLSVTTVADGAAPLRVVTHVITPAPVSDVGLHANEDSCRVADPDPKTRFDPVIGTGSPCAEDPRTSATPMARLVTGATVTVTLATTPAGIGLLLIPATMHRYAPVVAAHDICFWDDVSADPAITETAVIEAAGY